MRTQNEPDPRAAFFNARAVNWEANCYPPPVRERLPSLVASFHLPPGATVLDMGTGPGTLVPYLRKALGPSGRVFPFDLSLEMLRQVRSKLGPADPPPVLATAMRLPFRDESFDAVVCFAAFPHFEDKGRALSEMARVAKPGATVIISHLLSRAELLAHHGTHSAVAGDALPEETDMRQLFLLAGLPDPAIIDAPGHYHAVCRKPAGTPGGRA
ncbi:Methyltransferase type 11 [Solidesulfovibrio fructosivorans JJ]]|uniref:Methyltransferase type 11 n=1 Tax=Solidesulfovibrio fructosivorans JJ] TaxID=596151 RepID=E1JXD8_SOLFR|nr:class I SAM-dependent methyltransferase [Solidesulfovibrio fructosivorans]EFL50915.1 Methyltransferase type 11 [Solidesulfovibrio fructosivorans JJ]]